MLQMSRRVRDGMGLIQFHVERPELLSRDDDLSHIDFQMYDGRVVPATASLLHGILRCERQTSESGQMRLLWPRFDGRRQVMQTTSLREQAVPYHLELEIARGQLARLRNQHAAWTGAGLQTTSQLEQLITEAHRAFRAAILRVDTPETSTGAALLAIDLSSRAAELLCHLYTEQRLAYRRSRAARLPVFLGCHLHDVPADSDSFMAAFNAAQIDCGWDSIEREDGDYQWERLDRLVAWGQERRLFLTGGPLLDLANDRLPAWVRRWSKDFFNLQSFTADFVETVVGRYVGRVRHWEVVSGANTGGPTDLTEEQRLNLVARAVEAARQVDEHVLISLRIVLPWGEYLNRTANRLPAVQFVDTLRRCGVRLAEVNLEVRVGRDNASSLLRDGLSLSQLLDQWALLQLPLNVLLAPPATPPGTDGDFELTRIRWLREAVLTCLSKERVTGIYLLNWDQQSEPDDGTALLDREGRPRAALKLLQQLSDEFWS
jgi:hypothetical protein